MADQISDIMPDSPIKYIDRTRAYYLSQGFPKPYEWAQNTDIPFTPVNKPVSELRLALITTAAPIDTAGEKRRLHTRATQPLPEKFHTDDLAWDKETTHTNDLGSFFPMQHLLDMQHNGFIGSIAKDYYCVPTLFSQNHTCTVDAPNILEGLRADHVDIALLVPL